MIKGTRVVASARVAAVLALASFAGNAGAQDRLKSMPGYDQLQRMLPVYRSAITPMQIGGPGGVVWSPDWKTFEYNFSGTHYRYDITAKKATELGASTSPAGGGRGRGGGGQQPERGRQFALAIAPAGNHRAIYRDRNVWIGDSTGANAVQITTDGDAKARIKYGTASWVYGEELSQRTAMWWSPDGKKLAFYRFDESKVPDYYLATNLNAIQDTLDVEAYPKPGVPNPVVDLFVYDVDSKKTTRIDVRDGKPFDNTSIGHYVFRVDWSADGKELTFLRTNRRQNSMDLAACNPSSGACRVVIHEENPTGWIDDDPAPTMTWLKDGNRFIWESDRSGFTNYYLYDFKAAKLITPLTQLPAEVVSIVRVDETANAMYFTARDGDNYMKVQLHRVGLDGKNDKRLTDPAFTHSVSLAPDAKHFVDVAETHDQAPVARVMDANGAIVGELAKTDLTKMTQAGL
jgi:dipeptidyl-peptidase-4